MLIEYVNHFFIGNVKIIVSCHEWRGRGGRRETEEKIIATD